MRDRQRRSARRGRADSCSRRGPGWAEELKCRRHRTISEAAICPVGYATSTPFQKAIATQYSAAPTVVGELLPAVMVPIP